LSLDEELGLDEDLDLEENLDLELTGELEADLVAQLREEATSENNNLTTDLEEDDLLGDSELDDISPEDLEQTSTSRVDLGQADVKVEQSFSQLSPETLTHEQNIERQIADEVENDGDIDSDDSGEYEYESEGLDDEDEYLEPAQNTSLKNRVQDFFSGLAGKGGGGSKTVIMEKATQIFKLGQAKTGTVGQSTGFKAPSLRDSTVSRVLQEKIPALAKVLNKGKADSDSTTPDAGPTFKELTQISETDLELDDDANINLSGGKRQFKLDRKGLIYIFAALFFAWFVYDEFMGEKEEFPDLPDKPKEQRPKEPVVKEPVVEEPIEEPTIDDPIVQEPIEEPTIDDPIVQEPMEEPIIEDPVVKEQPIVKEPIDDTTLDPTDATKDKKAIDSALEEIRKKEEAERKRLEEQRKMEEQRKRQQDLESSTASEADPESDLDTYTGEEQILPQDVIEPPASNEITKQLLKDLEVKLKEERREQEILEDVKPTSAPSYDNIGKGLVYNCIDEHWACVNDESFKQCRGNYSWNRQQEVDTECYPYAQLGNEIDCATVQQEKIDTISATTFCK
tara:strand:+ start:1361 stop:3058 length:1698 start_codon:yes stop_codon:yes gene_type:complete